MKRKKIKSKDIGACAPSISCGDCGEDCYGASPDAQFAYALIDDVYWCEWCDQEWEFPEGKELKVIYVENPSYWRGKALAKKYKEDEEKEIGREDKG